MPQRQRGHGGGIGAQDARAEGGGVDLRQGAQALLFVHRKAAFGANQDRPFFAFCAGERGGLANHRLVTPQKLAVGGKAGEEFIKAGQIANFGDKGGPALLGGL